MSDNNKSVAEPIKRWQIVYVDEQGMLRPFKPSDGHCQPIGTAKRDIAKGEAIMYSPGRDTDDIEAVIHVT